MAAYLQCPHVKGPLLSPIQAHSLQNLLTLDSSSTGSESVLGLVTTLVNYPYTTNEILKKLQLKCPPWLLTEAGRSFIYTLSVCSFLQHIYKSAVAYFRLALFIDHVLKAGGLVELGHGDLTPLIKDLRQQTFTEGDLLLGLQASPDRVCRCFGDRRPDSSSIWYWSARSRCTTSSTHGDRFGI